jgi:uncharacterized RDD family membrane protein YckC
MREYISIDTPENVTFGYEVAGIGSRLMAYIIDLMFRYLPFVALILIITLLGFFIGDLLVYFQGMSTLLIILNILLFFSLHILYYVLFETYMRGQTPGKRFMKIRVVQQNGRPAGLSQIFIRNLFRFIAVFFWPLCYGISIIVMFINKNSQRVGDFAAGTMVVKERSYSEHSIENIGYIQGDKNKMEPKTELGIVLTTKEFEIIQKYLNRRSSMNQQSANELSDMILNNIIKHQPEHVKEAINTLLRSKSINATLHEIAKHYIRDHR